MQMQAHTLPLKGAQLIWNGPFLSGTLSILRSTANPANFFYTLEHHDTSLEGVHIFEDWESMLAEEIMNTLLTEVETKYIEFSTSLLREYKEIGGKLQ